MNDTLILLTRLFSQHYPEAKTAFLGGSSAQGKATPYSDLDIVILFEKLDHAYREAFEFEGIKIDAFIHDPETLEYFYEQYDVSTKMLGLPSMIGKGVEFPEKTAFGAALQERANALLNSKPTFTEKDCDSYRFQITDLLDDLKGCPEHSHEFYATAQELHRKLAEFILLLNGHWIGSGKILVRLLEACDSRMATDLFQSFQTLELEKISAFTQKILSTHGGLLWVGFRSDVPASFRKAVGRQEKPPI
jgi:predicted nucleotidyltransferase